MSAFRYFIRLSTAIILCLFSSAFAYSGGSGASVNPYQIATVSDWQQLMSTSGDWSSHFIMTADVNLYGVSLTPIGNLTKKFTGVFDGNDHIISNAVINQPSSNNVGLFGYIGENSNVHNLGVEDINVIGNYSVGGIAGYNYKGTISNCYSGGVVSGWEYIGGLVGYDNGTITACFATSKVNGSYRVGGLVGENLAINPLANSYATGDVNGLSYVGGLVGYNSGLGILKCYATGAVSGTYNVGGLIGDGGFGTSCFWDVNSTGQTTSAGDIGVVGKTTAEMKTLSTFLDAGWDFSYELPNGANEIWQTFVDGTDYPHLRWEYPKTYYSGGAGTEADPYQISNAFDWLQLMSSSEDWGKSFVMTADVNLAELTLTPIGNRILIIFPPLPPLVIGHAFTGVFDGRGHIISNVFINMDTDSYNVGLFGVTDVNSEIRNLGLTNVDITTNTPPFHDNGNDSVGGLVGRNDGTISNCYVVGEVFCSDYIGILVGQNIGILVGQNSGTIANCYSNGSVLGSNYVGGLCGTNNLGGVISQSYSNAGARGGWEIGGLVGANYNSTISNCHSNGAVSGTENVGGLAGYSSGEVKNCYAAGAVSSSSSSAGGLIGYNENGTISKCYASGAVSGKNFIGGLVACNTNGTISNCYATGEAICSSDYVGGLMGASSGSAVSKCYSTGAVSGPYYAINVGGLVGAASSSIADSFWNRETSGQTISAGGSDVVSKTTAEMKTLSIFTSAGWDFVSETVNGPNDIWRMCVDGVSYPKLSWQFKAGDFGCPDGVDVYDLAVFVDQWLFEVRSYDINNDRIVNFLDWAVFANSWQGDMSQLSEFASQWLQPSAYNADIAPNGGDGIVNMLDFAVFAGNWMNSE